MAETAPSPQSPRLPGAHDGAGLTGEGAAGESLARCGVTVAVPTLPPGGGLRESPLPSLVPSLQLPAPSGPVGAPWTHLQEISWRFLSTGPARASCSSQGSGHTRRTDPRSPPSSSLGLTSSRPASLEGVTLPACAGVWQPGPDCPGCVLLGRPAFLPATLGPASHLSLPQGLSGSRAPQIEAGWPRV